MGGLRMRWLEHDVLGLYNGFLERDWDDGGW